LDGCLPLGLLGVFDGDQEKDQEKKGSKDFSGIMGRIPGNWIDF